MQTKRFSIILLLTLAVLGCNLPVVTAPSSSEAVVLTAAAQTFIAITPQGALATVPFLSAAPQATPTNTLQGTPTSSAVLISVSTATNCRSGPGREYDLLDVLNVGETAEAVGQYPAANYWIIKRPHGTGVCWLWGEYVTVVGGEALLLPEMTPPPSPTPPPFPTPQPLTVTSVRAFVPSEPWQGTCPHTFRVWAEITLSGEGSGTLHYRWHRSDGFVGPDHTLEVSAGTYTVAGEWRVTQDGSYRIRIEISSPTSTISEWSAFHEVDCR